MSDIVQDLLRQLKGGKTDFTKRQVNDAITFYQSYMCEIESLRDLCGYQDTNNASDNIKKELEQLRAENSTLSKELDFYIRVCKDKGKNESKSEMECKALKTELTQIKDYLIKTKQELEESKNVIENFQCQYEKQRTENILVKNQLEQLKSDNRRLKVQFDKLTKNHEAAKKDINHYKARSTGLEQELEKLRLDYKNELDRYTNKEKLGRKMHEGAEYKNEEHYQDTNNASDNIKKELEQLRAENSTLSKELDFYIRVCKDKDKNESKSEMECKALKTELTQIKDYLIKTKQELEESKNVIENFQCQYEKQRTENILVKNQLEQLKSDNRRLKVQFDKLTKNHEAAKKDIKYYKARSTGLEQELEKLRLDYKNELDRYTNKEKLGRKMHEGAEYKNEEHYQHKEQAQPKAIEKLRHENTQLKEDKLKISEQINELKNKLSVLAGHKLTDGNPAIAELSDPFRPTNIAAQFRQLYDDEWTCALEELEEMFEREEEIFDFLACIIKDIDRFCIRARSQQLEHPKYFAKSVIQDPEHQPEAKEEKEKKILIFRQVSKSIKDKIGPKPPKGLEDFLEKAFELIWVMKMPDPAMEFVWSKPGDNFDKNMYTHYTKRGSKVTQCIWPAIVLHRAGPLMSKGVVQEN